jgi:hypothetical protein
MSSSLPERLRALLDLPEEERTIGAFRLKQQLGHGSFAPVWLASEMADRTTLRQAAIKLFAIDPRLGEQARQDIIAEAARLCRVEHPNIVRFYSLPVDEARGIVGLAMEYVGGESLAVRLRAEKRLGVREVVDVGIAVASALVAVHEAGLVHRDIWPANVIEDRALRGSPAAYKLIDFGIAVPGRDDAPAPVGPEALGGKRGYVDPVCWRDASRPTVRSDLYALGALLFVCLTGRIPASAEGSLDEGVLAGDKRAPKLGDLRADVPPALAELVADLLEPDPLARPHSADLVVVALELVRGGFSGRARALPPERDGPFRGLARFEREHRDVFFGRRVEVAAALEVLRTRGLLALVGPSGSGKSSLARAGILPALEEGALGGARPWDMVVLSPGVDPRRALMAGLFHMGIEASMEAEAAAARIDGWLSENRRGLVLLVDQLEELTTQEPGDAKLDASRVFAMDLLARLGERVRPALRVIVTARNDLLGPILAHRRLGRALIRGTALVAPLGSAEWGLVIDAALESYGYSFEDAALRAEVMTSLEQAAGAMPLVEFALAELWRARDPARKQITWACWKKLGGIAGALDQYAEATLYPEGHPVVKDAELKRVLLALTTPSGARATRLYPELVGHDAGAERAVRLLEEARLLVRESTREGERVTLSHEALLQHWRRLKHWVDAEREGRLLIEDLERVAGLWAEKRDDELLYRRRRILLVSEVLRRHGKALEGEAEAFYRASRSAARRSRIAIVSLLIALVAVAVVLREGYARQERRRIDAEHRVQDALLERQAANAEREKEHATLAALSAEKRKIELANEVLQQTLERQQTAGTPPMPKPIDATLLRDIEQYVLERLRQNEPMPPSLSRILTEANAQEPTPPAPPPPLPRPEAPPKPPAPPPMARGAAYSALYGAQATAAGCGSQDGPRGGGQVALVLDPSGKVSSVAMDKRFTGSDVGRCVADAFGRVSVPKFDGGAFTVVWSFVVR